MGKFHPMQPAYVLDPYPYLKRLRETEPVLYSPDLQGYVLTRYNDCSAVLRDDEHFSSDPALESGGMGESVRKSRACAALGNVPILANSDGVMHSRLRGVLADAFRARTVLASREAVESAVAEFIDAMDVSRPTDLMQAFAHQLPITVLLDFLGLPAPVRNEFRGCVVAIMRGRMDGDRSGDAVRDSEHGAAALAGVLARGCPEESRGLVGELRRHVAARRISEGELLMLVVHVATAGNAATAFAIGNALLAFAHHPEAWETVRADTALLPNAVDECLRYDSPTHITTRFALDGADVAGKHIPRGKAVHLVISSANRDPEAFPDPDVFDIQRRQQRQAAFGLGVHYCLGAPLAKLELECSLAALGRRYPRLEVARNGYEPGGTLLLRGPKRLVMAGV